MSQAEGVTSTPNVFSLHKQDDLLAAVRELNGHVARVADDLRMLCGLPHDPTIEIRLIDELIDLLDTLQLYDWDEREPDEDFEPDNDKEPSLGWTSSTKQEGAAFYGAGAWEHDIDRELDEADREPSLGSLEKSPLGGDVGRILEDRLAGYTGAETRVAGGDQTLWGSSETDDTEDEHDGREPEDSGCGDQDGLQEQSSGLFGGYYYV